MDKKLLIEKIKIQLKSLVSNIKLAEQMAGDLLICSDDETFAIGSEVYLRDKEGNNVPLLDGEYTFDDGVKIVVEAGRIKSMFADKEVKAEEEEKEEAKMTKEEDKEKMTEDEEDKEKITEDEDDKKEDMRKLYEKIKMIEDKVEEMGRKFEEAKEEAKKENEKMKQEFSKISGLPADNKIESSKAEFKSLEEKTNSFGMVDVMAIREKIRKNNR